MKPFGDAVESNQGNCHEGQSVVENANFTGWDFTGWDKSSKSHPALKDCPSPRLSWRTDEMRHVSEMTWLLSRS
jgi:hypothetical protein